MPSPLEILLRVIADTRGASDASAALKAVQEAAAEAAREGVAGAERSTAAEQQQTAAVKATAAALQEKAAASETARQSGQSDSPTAQPSDLAAADVAATEAANAATERSTVVTREATAATEADAAATQRGIDATVAGTAATEADTATAERANATTQAGVAASEQDAAATEAATQATDAGTEANAKYAAQLQAIAKQADAATASLQAQAAQLEQLIAKTEAAGGPTEKLQAQLTSVRSEAISRWLTTYRDGLSEVIIEEGNAGRSTAGLQQILAGLEPTTEKFTAATTKSNRELRNLSRFGGAGQQILSGLNQVASGGIYTFTGLAAAVRGVISLAITGLGPVGLTIAGLGAAVGGLAFIFRDELGAALGEGREKLDTSAESASRAKEELAGAAKSAQSFADVSLDPIAQALSEADSAAGLLQRSLEATLAVRQRLNELSLQTELSEARAAEQPDTGRIRELEDQLRIAQARQPEEQAAIRSQVAEQRAQDAADQVDELRRLLEQQQSFRNQFRAADLAPLTADDTREAGVRALQDERRRLQAQVDLTRGQELDPRVDAVTREQLGIDNAARRRRIEEIDRALDPSTLKEYQGAVLRAKETADALAKAEAELARRTSALAEARQREAQTRATTGTPDTPGTVLGEQTRATAADRAAEDRRTRLQAEQKAVADQLQQARETESQRRENFSEFERTRGTQVAQDLEREIQRRQNAATPPTPAGRDRQEFRAEFRSGADLLKAEQERTQRVQEEERRRQQIAEQAIDALQKKLDALKEQELALKVSAAVELDVSANNGTGVDTKEVAAEVIDQLPKREHGGRVRKDEPVIVGEKRAEIFQPDTDGTILPDASNPPFPPLSPVKPESDPTRNSQEATEETERQPLPTRTLPLNERATPDQRATSPAAPTPTADPTPKAERTPTADATPTAPRTPTAADPVDDGITRSNREALDQSDRRLAEKGTTEKIRTEAQARLDARAARDPQSRVSDNQSPGGEGAVQQRLAEREQRADESLRQRFPSAAEISGPTVAAIDRLERRLSALESQRGARDAQLLAVLSEIRDRNARVRVA